MIISPRETTCVRAISLASEIANGYQLASLRSLIESSRTLAERDELSVAVSGRFKAGKSSFLNHFLGRDFLPVGVVPVTAVVTEIGYGPREKAVVHFLDGRAQEVALPDIRYFIAENENPTNTKQVSLLKVELPELERMRALRFVDMPGLESALTHSTEAALNWLPNVDLALVAVSVDPPLSQHDIALLKNVYKYTPAVSILLTKVDLLDETERAEVIAYVRDRLKDTFTAAPKIFPYSVRPGYEHYKSHIEEDLFRETLNEFEEHRSVVLARKLETLLGECHDYLTLALKSAETIGSEREALKQLIIAEREALAEVKSELRLVVQHAAGGTRSSVAKRFDRHQTKLEARLSSELEQEFPAWTKNLRWALESFERWLNDSLSQALMVVSVEERAELAAPLGKLKQQVFRSSQNFRDRLSERTERAFGAPLHTTESEIEFEEPQTPDIRIGHVFDRNWELLSPVAPMFLVKPLVRRHFAGKVPHIIEKDLSRLTSQWAESIRDAMWQVLKEAERRLDELVESVERLLTTSSDETPRLRADLERIKLLLEELRHLKK